MSGQRHAPAAVGVYIYMCVCVCVCARGCVCIYIYISYIQNRKFHVVLNFRIAVDECVVRENESCSLQGMKVLFYCLD